MGWLGLGPDISSWCSQSLYQWKGCGDRVPKATPAPARAASAEGACAQLSVVSGPDSLTYPHISSYDPASTTVHILYIQFFCGLQSKLEILKLTEYSFASDIQRCVSSLSLPCSRGRFGLCPGSFKEEIFCFMSLFSVCHLYLNWGPSNLNL